MKLLPKAVAVASTMIAALSAAAAAQQPAGRTAARPSTGVESLLVGGYVDWLEKSDVSALREGVIDKMEMKVGKQVKQGGTIGVLHTETAELAVKKAQVAAESEGSIRKGEAQQEFAFAEAARLRLLNRKGNGFVSEAEIQKADAEVKVAAASIQEAKDNKRLAEAEQALAKQALAEHTIRAPFNGIVIERMRNPGESVRANEPVVRLGKIDTLKFFGDVPISNAFKVEEGMLVDIKPDIEGVELPVEAKPFRGKVTYVSREIISVNKSVVTVHAEVQNNNRFELMPGMKANMTVYLTKNPAEVPAAPADMLPEADDQAVPAAADANATLPALPGADAPAAGVGLAPRR